MIRNSFLARSLVLFAFAPDAATIAGGGSSGVSEVETTATAPNPGDEDAKDENKAVAAADAAKGPTPPPANSALATQAGKNTEAPHNPYNKGNRQVTRMIRVKILKGASYEQDGKHTAGHEVEVSTDRANELISCGSAAICEGAQEHDEDPEGVRKAIATNTPPVA